MEYYFNNLDPITFQRLINAILVARFGERVRLTPLRGPDNGRDAETAPTNPFCEFEVSPEEPVAPAPESPILRGRYLFQVKHHRTSEMRSTDSRKLLIQEFEEELRKNVLNRRETERVNHFILITNVSASADAIERVDTLLTEITPNLPYKLSADVWWEETVKARLDQLPKLWSSFPDLFAGRVVPLVAYVAAEHTGPARTVRLAMQQQYKRDRIVKFRQIELEKSIAKLFVDLDVDLRYFDFQELRALTEDQLLAPPKNQDLFAINLYRHQMARGYGSGLSLLLNERAPCAKRLLLEGGPGQGKSTITQMAAQIYREQFLELIPTEPEGRWSTPEIARLPLRLELKAFADWIAGFESAEPPSLEQFVAATLRQDAGGAELTVADVHSLAERSPLMLLLDGLDEVGSDELRDVVIDKILACVERLEQLNCDLRVVITTRPPALSGRRDRFNGFRRTSMAPLEPLRVDSYLKRWLAVHLHDNEDEIRRVSNSFQKRRNEPHVRALIKNPMQLSVLLHFIRLKGEAFPDRRAELYRDYFQIVIDRDVEKSPELLKIRETVEALHRFLGYKIHALTEAKQADGTLERPLLFSLVSNWLHSEGNETETVEKLFRVGEERLGLIVILKGDGPDARYGYEIQPIREYFAAAYVDEHIQGAADEIFENMVQRPFWREVAAFLAGLRRPKEKADLIARAKQIDNEPGNQWKQEGREIILQLLDEGVFHRPPYVFSDALDFILDLLDPHSVNPQKEPDGLLESLGNLIKQSKSPRHVARIRRLLDDFSGCDDRYIVFRLYSVARHVLSPSEFAEYLNRQRSNNVYLIADLRLSWALQWDIDISFMTSHSWFWESVPDRIWAERWWESAIACEGGTEFDGPTRLHAHLLAQFASNPLSIFNRPIAKSTKIVPKSKWAVWVLLRLQQLTPILRFGEEIPTFLRPAIDSFLSESLEVDYRGLPTQSRELVSELITFSQAVAKSVLFNEDFKDVFIKSGLQLLHFCNREGTDGWLAARCLLGSLRLVVMRRFSTVDNGRLPFSPGAVASFINKNRNIKLIWSTIQQFFRADGQRTSILQTRHLLNSFLPNPSNIRPFDWTPALVRKTYNSPPEPTLAMLVKALEAPGSASEEWVTTITHSASILRPLLEQVSGNLPDILRKISHLRIRGSNSGEPLLTPKVQQIVKLIRRNDDVELLTGAYVALSTSNYLNIAGVENTSKMLRVYRDDDVTPSLFPRANPGRRQAHAYYNYFILNQVSNIIIKSPTEFSFRLVCAASEFLVEHSSTSLDPLISREKELGLQIRSLS